MEMKLMIMMMMMMIPLCDQASVKDKIQGHPTTIFGKISVQKTI